SVRRNGPLGSNAALSDWGFRRGHARNLCQALAAQALTQTPAGWPSQAVLGGTPCKHAEPARKCEREGRAEAPVTAILLAKCQGDQIFDFSSRALRHALRLCALSQNAAASRACHPRLCAL